MASFKAYTPRDRTDELVRTVLPERIRLQAKLTKRCPHPNCRHLLIQPDTKTTRFKIKMVAMSYLPSIEIGRRRRRVGVTASLPSDSAEELEKKRRERRMTRMPVPEEDEPLTSPLKAGNIVSPQRARRVINTVKLTSFSIPFN